MTRNKINFLKDEPYSSIINILQIAPLFDEEFSKKIKPKMLADLLVKGYSVRGSDRLILDEFKEFLKKNEKSAGRIIFDQDIAGKDQHQGFNKLLQKLDGKWIDRPHGIVRLKKQKKIEPLKKWHSDFINKCFSDNVWKFYDCFVYHPEISPSDIKNEDLWSLDDICDFRDICSRFHPDYSHKEKKSNVSMNPAYDLRMLFDRIGLKKGNIKWKEYIKTHNVKPVTELYLYLELIQFHYKLTPQAQKRMQDVRNFQMKPIYISSLKEIDKLVQQQRQGETGLKNVNKIVTEIRSLLNLLDSEVTTEEFQSFESRFSTVFQNAFFRFIKERNIKYTKVDYIDDFDIVKKDFDFFLQDSALRRVEMGHFFVVMQPATVRHGDLPWFHSDEDEKGIEAITQANDVNFSPIFADRLEKDRKKLQNKAKKLMKGSFNDVEHVQNIKPLSFFEEYDFFKGFDKELNLLGYDDRHQLYKELHDVAIAFYVPNF